MQHVAQAGDDAAVIYLDVPRPRWAIVLRRRRHRRRATAPYGYEFAWADTRVAFFLVLAADWRRELEPRPVQL
jgi:hypothetical protein